MVYVVDSIYSNADKREVIIFANKDGFVYRMETGNSFDGEEFFSYFYTPYLPVTDPKVRKTFYRLTTFVDPEGRIQGSVTPRLNFDDAGVIQPPSATLATPETSSSVYGTAVYGVSRYGTKLVNTLVNPLIGSGFTLSLEYVFNGITPPFSIDALTIEYLNNDRQ